MRVSATSAPTKTGLLARIVLAIAIARLGFLFLARLYDLPTVEGTLGFSYAGMFSESWRWLAAFATGRDVGDLKLLNYPGISFFTGFVPVVTRAFAVGHAGVLLVASAAAWREPRARVLAAIAAALFVAGHAGMVIAGWKYHYGYLSAPAGVMILIAGGGYLGLLCSRSHRARWPAVAVQVLLILGFAFPEKLHVDLYYGGLGRYVKRVEACYQGQVPCRPY